MKPLEPKRFWCLGQNFFSPIATYSHGLGGVYHGSTGVISSPLSIQTLDELVTVTIELILVVIYFEYLGGCVFGCRFWNPFRMFEFHEVHDDVFGHLCVVRVWGIELYVSDCIICR